METILELKSIAYDYGVPKYAGQTMTKADFLRWESDDNYVYELDNGILEPTTGMKQEEILMLKQLTRRFQRTSAYEREGELVGEMDVVLLNDQVRRPSVAYYTGEQIQLIATGVTSIPGFVVEFGSVTDNELTSIKKRHEYFDAGVQVVWWVFPLYKEVYVYTSPKTVTICTDDDVLSAAPALPELQMTVADLFKR